MRQRVGLGLWLVGEADPGLVSNSQLVIYPHGAELANIGVISDYRNRGVGTAMIAILTNIARYLGLGSLEIGVADGNERASALYRRLGFAETRRLRIPGFQPAMILRKEL